MSETKTTVEIVRLWNEGEAGQAIGALCDRLEALERYEKMAAGKAETLESFDAQDARMETIEQSQVGVMSMFKKERAKWWWECACNPPKRHLVGEEWCKFCNDSCPERAPGQPTPLETQVIEARQRHDTREAVRETVAGAAVDLALHAPEQERATVEEPGSLGDVALRAIAARAAELFGDPAMFNSANFSIAFKEITGRVDGLDGNIVSWMLTGRSWVREHGTPNSAHWEILAALADDLTGLPQDCIDCTERPDTEDPSCCAELRRRYSEAIGKRGEPEPAFCTWAIREKDENYQALLGKIADIIDGRVAGLMLQAINFGEQHSRELETALREALRRLGVSKKYIDALKREVDAQRHRANEQATKRADQYDEIEALKAEVARLTSIPTDLPVLPAELDDAEDGWFQAKEWNHAAIELRRILIAERYARGHEEARLTETTGATLEPLPVPPPLPEPRHDFGLADKGVRDYATALRRIAEERGADAARLRTMLEALDQEHAAQTERVDSLEKANEEVTQIANERRGEVKQGEIAIHNLKIDLHNSTEALSQRETELAELKDQVEQLTAERDRQSQMATPRDRDREEIRTISEECKRLKDLAKKHGEDRAKAVATGIEMEGVLSEICTLLKVEVPANNLYGVFEAVRDALAEKADLKAWKDLQESIPGSYDDYVAFCKEIHSTFDLKPGDSAFTAVRAALVEGERLIKNHAIARSGADAIAVQKIDEAQSQRGEGEAGVRAGLAVIEGRFDETFEAFQRLDKAAVENSKPPHAQCRRDVAKQARLHFETLGAIRAAINEPATFGPRSAEERVGTIDEDDPNYWNCHCKSKRARRARRHSMKLALACRLCNTRRPTTEDETHE